MLLTYILVLKHILTSPKGPPSSTMGVGMKNSNFIRLFKNYENRKLLCKQLSYAEAELIKKIIINE